MPSPFPGMDPYLEAPYIWPDFHNALAGEIRTALNQSLPRPYYARLEMRPEVGLRDESEGSRSIIPDVAVARLPGGGTTALAELPRTSISPSLEVTVEAPQFRHAFVEVRDPDRGHDLITLVEIVSPSNKQSGPDRRSYLLKQQEVLESDANLVELDLLRGGARLLALATLERFVAGLEPAPDYLALVNRAWRRLSERLAYQVFPILLTESLPCIPIPLREGEKEVPLDLQFLFNRVYDGGPYQRGGVNYDEAPTPPLTQAKARWAEELLRRKV